MIDKKQEKTMITYTYRPTGVCSQLMEITLDGDVIQSLDVIGGCNGNLQGIARLVQGLPIDTVIDKLSGIRCGYKDTSCPDQLARALQQLKQDLAEQST